MQKWIVVCWYYVTQKRIKVAHNEKVFSFAHRLLSKLMSKVINDVYEDKQTTMRKNFMYIYIYKHDRLIRIIFLRTSLGSRMSCREIHRHPEKHFFRYY